MKNALAPVGTTFEERWRKTANAWNERALDRINRNRDRLGMDPIADVLDYVLTDHTWLAADAALAPLPVTANASQKRSSSLNRRCCDPQAQSERRLQGPTTIRGLGDVRIRPADPQQTPRPTGSRFRRPSPVSSSTKPTCPENYRRNSIGSEPRHRGLGAGVSWRERRRLQGASFAPKIRNGNRDACGTLSDMRR